MPLYAIIHVQGQIAQRNNITGATNRMTIESNGTATIDAVVRKHNNASAMLMSITDVFMTMVTSGAKNGTKELLIDELELNGIEVDASISTAKLAQSVKALQASLTMEMIECDNTLVALRSAATSALSATVTHATTRNAITHSGITVSSSEARRLINAPSDVKRSFVAAALAARTAALAAHDTAQAKKCRDALRSIGYYISDASTHNM